MAKNDEKINFSMTFEGEGAKRFLEVKKFYGLENNTEIIRTLVSEKYNQLFPKKKEA
jgi:hypothetical protein